ncbi:PucR family transcriptional regulator [Bacillus infantis]|uniref:PucR family transcriptional regulator n=1 Tax=Bacillus infantis TaxID=324767 RepID=UPI003CE874C3
MYSSDAIALPGNASIKLQMLAELLKENEANSRIWIYNGKIVAVLASDFDKETLTQILRDGSHVRIGVSALGAVGTIESIQILYSQSATALTHSKTHELQLSFWDEMGIEKVGYNLHSHHLFPHFDEEILGPLLSYDQKKNASLTETLYIYLKHFCSLQKASSELYIHPNTVKYRLSMNFFLWISKTQLIIPCSYWPFLYTILNKTMTNTICL